MAEKTKPVFNKRIFGSVVFENINYGTKTNFVIERVSEWENAEDNSNCHRYYGDEKVAGALLKAKFLPETSMYLASAGINKPLKKLDVTP